MALSPAQQKVWDEAKALGYDDEAAAISVAVGSAEGLGSTRRGDSGHSSGNFQFFFGGGAGDTWSAQTGHTQAELDANPFLGDQWWLQGPLGQAIQQGRAIGLKGADLAKFAGRVAEKPAEGNDVNYYTNYQQIFGTGNPASQTIDGPGPGLPPAQNEPGIFDPTTGKITAPNPDVLPGVPLPGTIPQQGDTPQPQITGSTATPEATAITAVAQATGQVSQSLSPIAAIASFFTNLFSTGSNVWTGLEVLLWKLIATLLLGILLIVGILRATGTQEIATKAAIGAVA